MGDERISAHLYLDDNPIGPYVGTLDITEGEYSRDEQVRRQYTLTLSELESLRLHLDNTLDALKDRMLRDAIAGDCKRCKNGRMIDGVRADGRTVMNVEHCPACLPRVTVVMKALSEGRPPTRGEQSVRQHPKKGER